MSRLVLTTVLLFGACANRAELERHAKALIEEGSARQSAPLELIAERVSTELRVDDSDAYRIGRRDVIDVRVVDHPEFAWPLATRDDRPTHFEVQDDGLIHVPLIGSVMAADATSMELRRTLIGKLKEIVESPQVSVTVQAYRSQRFYVLGAVERPGAFAVDGRVNLLDGIGRAGGARSGADLEGAYVVRGSVVLPVSVADILRRGDVRRNIRMRGGDLVYIPGDEQWRVYVLGDVKNPGIVRVPQSGLTLAAAIAGSGGLDLTNANRNQIRIFRGSWQNPRAFTLSFDQVMRYGHAIRLHLGDRIYVAPRRLATWNRVLTLITPLIQSGITVAALED